MTSPARTASTVALAAMGWFVVALVVQHLLPTGHDPIAETTSHYANGRFGPLMTATFPGASVAVTALIIGLWRTQHEASRSRVGLALLSVFAVGALIAMSFPIDPMGSPLTPSGRIHRTVGPISFLSLSLGALLTSRALRKDERWRPVADLALGLAAVLLLLFPLLGYRIAQQTGFAGLVQRALLICFASWVCAVALRMRRIESAADRSAGP